MMLNFITSPQNQRVKDLVKLREHRQRAKQGRILIDGSRELLRALAGGIDIEQAYVCESLCQSRESQELLVELANAGVDVWHVTPEVFEKMSYGDRAEGVLAVAATPRRTLASLPMKDDPLVAVIEGVEKPGNVGAVLRSADAVGVDAVIVADGGTDLFNPNAIRASLGTIFTVPVCAASTDQTIAWLRERKFRVYAARVRGAVDYTEADYRGAAAIVLGSEADGLSIAWQAEDVIGVQLPMLGVADSLNVSATAAVLFYEALRQRRASGL